MRRRPETSRLSYGVDGTRPVRCHPSSGNTRGAPAGERASVGRGLGRLRRWGDVSGSPNDVSSGGLVMLWTCRACLRVQSHQDGRALLHHSVPEPWVFGGRALSRPGATTPGRSAATLPGDVPLTRSAGTSLGLVGGSDVALLCHRRASTSPHSASTTCWRTAASASCPADGLQSLSVASRTGESQG